MNSKSLFKRIITAMLGVVMTANLVSCTTATPSSSASSASQSKDSSSQAASSAATTSSSTVDREKKDVVLTVFVQQSATTDSGEWKGWGAEKLFEDEKIKLDFYPTGNETEQKLNQYLASGSLPDIIGFKGLDQAQLAINANMLLPLDEHKEQLPSIFENPLYADAINYSTKYTSNDTGKLFIMPVAIGPASLNAYNWVPLLQWDAYKKAGKPEIKTLEDYLDVVEKMVKEKPTTPNGEKVYGFSLFSDWDKFTALEVATLSFFYGIDSEYVSHLMETNILTKETKSILADDSFYKRALKFYFNANQRGLMDPDSMTQTYSNVEAKYNAGRIMFSHFSWMTGSYNSPASGHVDNKDAPDGYASVIAKDMKIYDAPDQTIGRNWYFAVNKDCKEPSRAADFMNWFYNIDTIDYLTNGPEGALWEFDGKEPKVKDTGWAVIDKKTEPVMPLPAGGSFQDGMYSFNTPGLSASVINPKTNYTLSYRYWPTTLTRNPTLMKTEVNEFLGASTLAEYLTKNNMIAKSTQAVNMIPTISAELEMTISQIGEIIKKYSWQMIYSKNEAEFDALWKKMQSESKGLGIDNVTEYYTKAWAEAVTKVKDFEK